MTPPLIAIEGVDGAGKTTLARALAATLNARIIKRPIPGSVAAELIKAHRDDPALAPDLLSALHDDCSEALKAARAYQAQGHAVILDRHYLSTAIYQCGDKWHAMAKDSIQYWGEPSTWIICEAVPFEILERIAARVADQDENTALDEIKLRINKYAHAPVTNAIRFFSIGNDPESCTVVLSCSWTDEVAGGIYGLPDAVEWIANRLARL